MPRVCLMESLTAVLATSWDWEGEGGPSKIVGPARMRRGRICVLCILIYNPSLSVDSSRSKNKISSFRKRLSCVWSAPVWKEYRLALCRGWLLRKGREFIFGQTSFESPEAKIWKSQLNFCDNTIWIISFFGADQSHSCYVVCNTNKTRVLLRKRLSKNTRKTVPYGT